MTDADNIIQCLRLIQTLADLKKRDNMLEDNWTSSSSIRLWERTKIIHRHLQAVLYSAFELEHSSTVQPPSSETVINLLAVLRDICTFSDKLKLNDAASNNFSSIIEIMELNFRLDRCARELNIFTTVNIDEHRGQDLDDINLFFMEATKSMVKFICEDTEPSYTDKQTRLEELESVINTAWSDIIRVRTDLSSSLQVCETIYQCVSMVQDSYRRVSRTEDNMDVLVKPDANIHDQLMIERLQNENMVGAMNNEEELQWKARSLAEFKIKSQEVEVTNVSLGQGSFGQVQLGYFCNSKVAVKSIVIRNESYSAVENELLIMKYLGEYPTLLTCYGYTQSESVCHVILEFSPFGALSDLLYNRNNILPEIFPALMLAWLYDLSDALSYLHRKRVKHRDVKAQNMLVFDMFRIKLCDFGLAKEHAGSLSSIGVGTLDFMAPEVVTGRGSKYASDVYSFAMTAVQVFTRKPPDRNAENLLPLAVNCIDVLNQSSLLFLLSECINQDHEQRPTSHEVHDKISIILNENGSDPRKIGNQMYGAVIQLNKSVLAKRGVIAIATLNSDDALKLLIYLGCRADLAIKTEVLEFTINGAYLTTINRVEILQLLECDYDPSRKLILDDVHSNLKELIRTGLTNDIMIKIREVVLYAKLTNVSLRQAVRDWCFDKHKARLKYGNITKWNTEQVTDMKDLFKNMTSFNDDISGWDVSHVIDMSGMFYGASSFNQPLNSWNVSNVTSIGAMFALASTFNQPLDRWDVSNTNNASCVFFKASNFNQPLKTWNVSNVSNMGCMFYGAACFNQPLNSWNVANVTAMSGTFRGASSFNQPLNSWNVSKVTHISGMFQEASTFNQPLNTWNVSNVTSINLMFEQASRFNQSLNNWNVANVTEMKRFLSGASSFNQPLNSWNVSKVTTMEHMFQGASAFDQPLNDWNVANVTDMNAMFDGAGTFNQSLNSWNISNVIDMKRMFRGAICFNQPLNSWNVSNVSDMSALFDGAISFNQPLNSWNVSNVVDLRDIFKNARQFNKSLNDWNVSSVRIMRGSFENAHRFNQPLNNWNVSNVVDMGKMFSNASEFNQPLHNWNVFSVIDMSAMFENASNFNQPLNNWDVSNVSHMSTMFFHASSFNQRLNSWNVVNVTTMRAMFKGASMFNQPLNDWDIVNVADVTDMFDDIAKINEVGNRNIRRRIEREIH